MKKINYYHTILVCLFITFLNNNDIVAKTTNIHIPEWVLEDWKLRTAASGLWITDNKLYKSDQEIFDAYAIHWEYGIGEKHLKGRLYGMIEGEDIGSFWQFTEYWDAINKKLKVIQIGSDGTVGNGEIWQTEDGKMKEFQTFVTLDGIKYSSGHIMWMENGVHNTESYNINDDKWIKNRFYKWELQKMEEVKIPNEYGQIAYLIGNWEINLGEDKARMTFSWGKNKRAILYKNEFKSSKTNKWVQENEGLITYNGVKDALMFITSYSFLNDQLMAIGEFRFDNDGTIHREFVCHYKEGAGLPWSDGAKAPKGGKSIDFKQIWTPVDQDNFKGEFFWLKNGVWENPIKKFSKNEMWTRIK